MTVSCPRCGTRYRRPARLRGGADATFRCARCRHVFESEPEEPALVRGDDADQPEDETFTFGDEEEEPVLDTPPRLPVRPRRAAPRAGEDDARAGTPALRFALRSTLAVTATYAVLSIYLYTHPQSTRDALEQVPLVGPGLAERRLHPGSIQLTDVRGDYVRVKGDRLVFVITGTALNTAAVPVRGVQVQGRIVGPAERRQVVFVGGAPRDVHDLSLREIALLQTIEPSRDWALAPGEQSSFLVAFPDPALDLREFTAEVVAVQAPRRARPAPADVASR